MAASTTESMDSFLFAHGGQERTIYCREQAGGRGILLLQELPGITEHSLALIDRLYDDGFSVYLPHLFGDVGQRYSVGKSLVSICLRREFALLNRRKSAEFTEWLRALARLLQQRTDGKVGAIGMCLTGGFVLSLVIDDAVAAPVASQPSHLGNVFSAKWKQSTGLSGSDEARVVACTAVGDKPLLALRFNRDVMCPRERFDRYEEIFGAGFEAAVLPSPKMLSHSVLTVDYDPAAGSDTEQAYRQTVSYLNTHLA